MPSPFPGMDPFVEINPRWEGFHAWFVRELARQALPKAQEYREKRLHWLAARAHFMEIDLLRDGENPSRRLFPELPPTPYFIFVARKTGLGRNEEGYPLRLQDPLPVIGLPLGPPRPDLPLDLASAFRAAFDLSIRPGSIDYEHEMPPPPALEAADSEWMKSIVTARKDACG